LDFEPISSKFFGWLTSFNTIALLGLSLAMLASHILETRRIRAGRCAERTNGGLNLTIILGMMMASEMLQYAHSLWQISSGFFSETSPVISSMIRARFLSVVLPVLAISLVGLVIGAREAGGPRAILSGLRSGILVGKPLVSVSVVILMSAYLAVLTIGWKIIRPSQ
jgi:hypothetical protein